MSQNFVVAYGVLFSSAAVAGVALNGVNDTVFYLPNNTDLVSQSILRFGRTVGAILVEEDNHFG